MLCCILSSSIIRRGKDFVALGLKTSIFCKSPHQRHLEMIDNQRTVVECFSGIDILHSTYRIVAHDLEVFGKIFEMLDSNDFHNLHVLVNHICLSRHAIYCLRFLADSLSISLLLTQHIACFRNPDMFGEKWCMPWTEL